MAASKSVKPYSLSRAALVGSAAEASLLVCVASCICQPANCFGRMGKAGESAPGPAAETALTLQVTTKHTPTANTSTDLEARMNKPLGTESLLLLDHRGWEKVSGRNY